MIKTELVQKANTLSYPLMRKDPDTGCVWLITKEYVKNRTTYSIGTVIHRGETFNALGTYCDMWVIYDYPIYKGDVLIKGSEKE